MYSLLKSKNDTAQIVKKALIGILIGAFLFNDIAYATDYKNLAPWKVANSPEFEREFKEGVEAVAMRYIDQYIQGVGGFNELKDTYEDSISEGAEGIKITIAPIPGVTKKFNLYTCIDFDKYSNRPIIFIDYGHRYDDKIIREAKEKIRSGKKKTLIFGDADGSVERVVSGEAVLRENKAPELNHAAVEQASKNRQDIPRQVLKNASSDSDKVGTFIAAMMPEFSAITKDLRVAFVMPMYTNAEGKGEAERLLPASDENTAGEDALAKKVAQLEALRKANPKFDWRLITVDDGSPEGASAKCINDLLSRRITKEFSADVAARVSVHIITPEEKAGLNSKKGGAVLRGFGEALKDGWADYIGYTDTDTSTDMRQAAGLILPLVNNSADVAIGSRRIKGGEAISVPLSGKITSVLYNWYVRSVLYPYLSNIKDTQRGFKLFKREVVKEILPFTKDSGFSFDTELLLLAQLDNKRIQEIPIIWVDSPGAATMVPLKEAPKAAIAVLKQLRHIFNNPFKTAGGPALGGLGIMPLSGRNNIGGPAEMIFGILRTFIRPSIFFAADNNKNAATSDTSAESPDGSDIDKWIKLKIMLISVDPAEGKQIKALLHDPEI